METLRPYDLVTVLPVAAAGAALAEARPDPVMVLLAAAMALAACVGALYTADYLTRGDDLTTKPDRPIPSGRLPAATVRYGAAIGTVTALAITAAVNWHGVAFIAAAAAGQLAYARWLKDNGWWGDLAVGLSGWSCALLTAATFTAVWPPPALWLPAVVLGLQGTFSNTLLALGDLETDRTVGRRTLPVRHGPAGAVIAMTGCAASCYALTALTPYALHRSPTTGFVTLAAAAALLATACLALASSRHGDSRGNWATELHLYERVMLPSGFLALTAEALPVLCVAVTGACVLAVTPRAMLSNHPN